MNNTSMISVNWALIKHEFVSLWRNSHDWLYPIGFFVLVMLLFPLAISIDPILLKQIAPGVIWVAALLAMLLGLESLFRDDYLSGVLEQCLLSAYPLAGLVFIKIGLRWLITIVPILFIAALMGALLHLTPHAIGILLLTLALGTPILLLLGAIGAALTVALPRSGLLLGVIILPLYIPVLIFGAGAVAQAEAGVAVIGVLALLLALLIVATVVLPVVIAAALKIGMSAS